MMVFINPKVHPSPNKGIQSNAPIVKAKGHIIECSQFGQHSN
jgi:hypothetical protein